jgi:hypothetical protein
LNANHTAHDLLNELGRGQNVARPAPKVVNFLRQVEDLTKDLLSTPLTDWQQELEALRRDLKQEIQAVKAAVEPPARQTVRSFAEAVARAPGPAHYQSSYSSSSSSLTRESQKTVPSLFQDIEVLERSMRTIGTLVHIYLLSITHQRDRSYTVLAQM